MQSVAPPQGTTPKVEVKTDWRVYLLHGFSSVAGLIVVIYGATQQANLVLWAGIVLLAAFGTISTAKIGWPRLESFIDSRKRKTNQARFVDEHREEFLELVDDFDRYADRNYSDITSPMWDVLNDLDDPPKLPKPWEIRNLHRACSRLLEQTSIDRRNFESLLKMFLELVEFHNKVFVYEPLGIIRQADPSVRDYRQDEYEKYRRDYLNLMDQCEELAEDADEVFGRVHFHYRHPPSRLTSQDGSG